MPNFFVLSCLSNENNTVYTGMAYVFLDLAGSKATLQLAK